MEYLRRLLDYASGLILKLGSPARDSPAKASHEALVKELSAVSSGSRDTQTAFFTTLVKGLRFIFEQLQVRSIISSPFVLISMIPDVPDIIIDRGLFLYSMALCFLVCLYLWQFQSCTSDECSMWLV